MGQAMGAALAAGLGFEEVDDQEFGGGDGDDDGALAEALTEAVGVALERLMGTRFGDRHRHLDADAQEATLAVLGEPVDDRPGWRPLAAVLTGMVLNDVGCHVLGTC